LFALVLPIVTGMELVILSMVELHNVNAPQGGLVQIARHRCVQELHSAVDMELVTFKQLLFPVIAMLDGQALIVPYHKLVVLVHPFAMDMERAMGIQARALVVRDGQAMLVILSCCIVQESLCVLEMECVLQTIPHPLPTAIVVQDGLEVHAMSQQLIVQMDVLLMGYATHRHFHQFVIVKVNGLMQRAPKKSFKQFQAVTTSSLNGQ